MHYKLFILIIKTYISLAFYSPLLFANNKILAFNLQPIEKVENEQFKVDAYFDFEKGSININVYNKFLKHNNSFNSREHEITSDLNNIRIANDELGRMSQFAILNFVQFQLQYDKHYDRVESANINDCKFDFFYELKKEKADSMTLYTQMIKKCPDEIKDYKKYFHYKEISNEWIKIKQGEL